MAICAYCSEEIEDSATKPRKYCNNSCKMRDYRRRIVTPEKSNAMESVTNLGFDDLPFDVRIQINSVAVDEQDWELRVERALRYQAIFPDNRNVSTICSCRKCQRKNAEFAIKPEWGI